MILNYVQSSEKMTNINLLINSARIVLTVLDLKQKLITGTTNSNVLFSNGSNAEVQERSSFRDIRHSEDFYQNPVLSWNSPDPGVLRLEDGSGWALVTTTNGAAGKSSAFPIYFSKGKISTKYLLSIIFYKYFHML